MGSSNCQRAMGFRLLSAVRTYLGVPYDLGGLSREGTDCSGVIVMSARDVGRPLPRVHSNGLWQLCYPLGKRNPFDIPGALVFQSRAKDVGKDRPDGIVHCAVTVGDGQSIVHARGKVKEVKTRESWEFAGTLWPLPAEEGSSQHDMGAGLVALGGAGLILAT